MKKVNYIFKGIKKSFSNNLFMFKIILKFSKVYVLVYSLMTIIDGLFPLVGLYLPKILIDMISRGDDVSKIIILIVIYFLICVTYFVFSNLLKGHYLQPKSDLLFNHISLILKDKIAHLDMRFLEDPRYHDLLEKASKVSNGEGINVIRNTFSIISSIITIVSISFIIFKINYIVVLIVIAVVIINAILNIYSKQVEIKTYNALAPERRKIGYSFGLLSDPKYYKEIRIFDLQDWLYNKAIGLVVSMLASIKKSIWNMHKYAMIGAIFNILQEAILFLLLGIQALNRVISFGEFVLYINSISKYSDQLNKIIWSFIQIHSSGLYIENFREFISIKNDIITEFGSIMDLPRNFDLRMSNVSFHYPGHDKLVLNAINVSLKSGFKYAIVGPNGAGKTTFVKLLLRLYDPSEGQIKLNDVDIKTINYVSYQKQFGVVFQDFQAYAFTFAENIVLSNEFDDKKLSKVFADTGLETKIRSLKCGSATSIQKIFDPEGIELSGGEQQKLAIARCLYRDSEIVVLDEPSSALDPYAEKEIYENIMNIRSDSTLIFITHRLTSVKKADYILYFEDGKILESGTHDELMQLEGRYCSMFNSQAEHYK